MLQQLTPGSVKAAREWFAQNALACIDEAVTGRVRVNDLTKYVTWQTQRYDDALAGRNDHTFTFWQRAYFIQTGESVAFLPK